MNFEGALLVESLHFKVCFCVIVFTVVIVTKSADNVENKHFPPLFSQEIHTYDYYGTGSSTTSPSILSVTKASPSGKIYHLLVLYHYYYRRLPVLREPLLLYTVAFLPFWGFFTPKSNSHKQGTDIVGRGVSQ